MERIDGEALRRLLQSRGAGEACPSEKGQLIRGEDGAAAVLFWEETGTEKENERILKETVRRIFPGEELGAVDRKTATRN